ncbi:MAG: aminotransferase class I/II-fold pyridoxal phosphate-dependent enzyme [Fimbriimonadales bacterium]
MSEQFDPHESLAAMRHEFGEHGGVNMSIEASTTFTVMEAELMPEIFGGRRGPEGGCYLYGRHFNPTVYSLAKEMAAIEGTGAAYCTASGMSAIVSTLMQLCSQGDHIVSSRVIYGGAYAVLKNLLPDKCGISTTMADITDLDAVESAFTDRTKVLYIESLGNPTLIIADIPKLAVIAHRHGAKLVVDNTFSPMILTPARHGADVVVHSMTKFLSGASDIIAGAICASKQFIMELMDVNAGTLMLCGPTMDPKVAFELSLRLPHLGLRMKEHSLRARFFAEKLEGRGLSVIYPGLPSHPQHELLQRMSNEGFGAGGVFCLDLETTERAYDFMELLQKDRFGYIAVSLGYFDTLMSASAGTTSSELSDEDRKAIALSPGLIRFSLGLTGSLEQRWSQFERALSGSGL